MPGADNSGVRRCARCDAAVPLEARWCSLCHAAFEAPYVPPPPPEPVYSRWAGDAVSLGPRARVAWTAGAVLVPVAVVAYVGVIGMFVVVAWLFLAPVVLRDVWRRTRVRPSR